MRDTDKIIDKMFNAKSWGIPDTIEAKRGQLHKNLTDQVNGYWSGSTAYWIMTQGGFLVDGKSSTMKKLTVLGEMFMEEMGGLKHNRINSNAKEV
ncbi:hypothetical protein NVP1101O_008 [Vibrio phage 1.101.O._10N.261.45.C6]|nr:hypothetical protein NVP1101O_008 [Vibrio phage 1.101.O._10N.261.45.C6]